MGLSGNKKRSKLSEDPNNTAWSKNTTNFGHKILSKQGWKQGDYLGAENANHSAHFTAANASHIRVMLREDNLGLGAQVGKGNAETFGLSMFSGLLGRLNGKSDEEVQKKQDTLRDAELRTYQANKYGFMNFVRGGLLVGDKMEFPESTKIEDIKKMSKSVASGSKQSKKRKASQEDDGAESSKKRRKSEAKSSQADEEIASKKLEKRKKRKSPSEDSQDSSSESSDEVDAKEEKRRRKERRKAEKAAKASKELTEDDEDDEKVRLKAEKRALKEERRKRREEKRLKRAAKESGNTSKQTSTAASESEGTATPPILNGGLPMTGGRHAVRQRYIMQKRMASMNATALKEIFMLKPQPAS